MNKANSPVLDKILNGHKFKLKDGLHTGYEYSFTQSLPLPCLEQYNIHLESGSLIATLDTDNSKGDTLAVWAHALGKIAMITIDISELELLE